MCTLSLSLVPDFISRKLMEITLSLSNGPTWVRTRDLPVMSRWLYQLSYGPYDHYIPSSRGVNPSLVISRIVH